MRCHYRWVALAATLLTSSLALAAPAGPNPLTRPEGPPVFFGGMGQAPLEGAGGLGHAPLDTGNSPNALARPETNYGPVTPVPEPSEWLMMLAGLGMVGVIVRRGARRS